MGRLSMRILLVAVTVALTACGATDTGGGGDGGAANASADGSKEIKIGATVARTGPNSVIFPIFQSTSACFKRINDAGGINGYTFDYVMSDDQYDPAKTVGAIRQLVDRDQVFALVSSGGTATNLAIKDYIAAKGIPNIGPQTGQPKAASPYTYLFIQDSVVEGAFQAKYAYDELGAKQLGIIYENDDVGKPFQEGAAHTASERGEKLVKVPFQLGTRDLVPAVSKLKSAGADAVIVSGVSSVPPPIIRAADSIGYTPKWIAVAYALSPSTIKELPTRQVDNMNLTFWATLPNADEAADMRDALAKYYPDVEPSPLTVMGWVPCTIFAAAFEEITAEGKAPDRDALREALDRFEDYSNDFISGITYAPGDGVSEPHVPRPQELVATWKDGTLETVQPFSEAPKVPGQPGQ